MIAKIIGVTTAALIGLVLFACLVVAVGVTIDAIAEYKETHDH